MALSTLIRTQNTRSALLPIQVGMGFPLALFQVCWISENILKGRCRIEMKLLFPSKPNCCVLSLWTNSYFQLSWDLAALPGIASLHKSYTLSPILCPGFGSPENSLPQRQLSPLWLGQSGAVWGYVGLCRAVQSSAKQCRKTVQWNTFSFILNILCLQLSIPSW